MFQGSVITAMAVSELPIHEVDPFSLDVDRYADMMPHSSTALSDEEHRRLIASLRQRGQEEPCEVYGNAVLDGRRRVMACRELQLTCKIRVWPPGSFASKREIQARIVEIQCRRRNATQQEYNRLLALEAADSKARGERREDFVRQKATSLGKPPSVVKDMIRGGQDVMRLKAGVLDAINRVCSSPDSVIARMCLLDHDSQAEVVAACDTEKAMRAEIERRLTEKAKAKLSPEMASQPETIAPMSQDKAVIFAVDNGFASLMKLLESWHAKRDNPWSQECLEWMTVARQCFEKSKEESQ